MRDRVRHWALLGVEVSVGLLDTYIVTSYKCRRVMYQYLRSGPPRRSGPARRLRPTL